VRKDTLNQALVICLEAIAKLLGIQAQHLLMPPHNAQLGDGGKTIAGYE